MSFVINALKALVIVDALGSWLLSDATFPRSVTQPLLDPVYAPVRMLLGPLTGPVDLSPLIALGLLHAVQLIGRDRPGD